MLNQLSGDWTPQEEFEIVAHVSRRLEDIAIQQNLKVIQVGDLGNVEAVRVLILDMPVVLHEYREAVGYVYIYMPKSKESFWDEGFRILENALGLQPSEVPWILDTL